MLAYITGGIMLAQFIYHAWEDYKESQKPKPAMPRPDIPHIEEGATIPIYFGRCRIRSPIVVWTGEGRSRLPLPDTTPLYELSMMFVLGIPFFDGTNDLHGMFVGDMKMLWDDATGGSPPYTIDGTGFTLAHRVERPDIDFGDPDDNDSQGKLSRIGGYIDFLDGNSGQTLFDVGTTDPSNETGYRVSGDNPIAVSTVDDVSTLLPGFRGYACATLVGNGTGFYIGSSPQPPTFSFETSTYPSVSLDAISIGDDANPADVIYEILRGQFAKLGLTVIGGGNLDSLVDYESFRSSAEALNIEVHGFSRAFEATATGEEMINEVLRQIDALIYQDPVDSKIKLKLIRDDYVAADCLLINVNNCKELTNAAAGGWTGRPNKIRVVFTNRDDNYRDGSAVAQNQANAVGQNGLVEEITINHPGISNATLAGQVASRELAARSRPLFKCSAIVSRDFLRTVPGDVVRVTWSPWNISSMYMRVVGVTRGSMENGEIKLDLIQDLFFVHRGLIVDGGSHGTIDPFPSPGGLLG